MKYQCKTTTSTLRFIVLMLCVLIISITLSITLDYLIELNGFEKFIGFLFLGISVFIITYITSGLLEVEFKDDFFTIKFIRKPYFNNIKKQKIYYHQIKKWNFPVRFRGPQVLVIHLESNEKIRLTFSDFIFSSKDSEFRQAFENWIDDNNKTSTQKEKSYSVYEKRRLKKSKIYRFFHYLFGYY